MHNGNRDNKSGIFFLNFEGKYFMNDKILRKFATSFDLLEDEEFNGTFDLYEKTLGGTAFLVGYKLGKRNVATTLYDLLNNI